MIVRPCTPLDREALATIAAECGATLDFDRELTRSYGRLWVACESAASQPTAFLLGWIAGDEFEIIDLCTCLTKRRRGAARALLDHATSEVLRAGLSALCLEVRESNHAARALYAGAGFEEVGQRAAYYADTGEDARLLRLPLDAAARGTGPATAGTNAGARP